MDTKEYIKSMVGDIPEKSTKNFSGQIRLLAGKLVSSALKE